MATIHLSEKIKNRSATVGVIGLGYVGLPLAVGFAEAGFNVIGFEVDSSKCDAIHRGDSYIQDIPSSALKALSGKLFATTDFSRLKDVDTVSICVPTPLNKTRDPDISFILNAKREIERHLHAGMAIILESTTYPGTTEEIFLPMIETSKFKLGEDVFVAFSPERIDPGNEKFQLKNTPKVVGGATPNCTEIATALYASVVDRVVPVGSPRSAEMVKILENTYRAVNIGLVNEVAIMSRILGIDTWEVIDAAATKPFGFTPFYPGPGLGGHCIPVDPHYLSWKLRTLNYDARFINLAAEVNTHMPHYVVELTQDALNRHQKSLNGSNVLVLGMAYKADIADVRESPSLDIFSVLASKGSRVSYHDPHASSVVIGEKTFASVELNDALIEAQDAVVLCTNHKTYDITHICKKARILVDTRNATKGLRGENIVRL